LSHQNRAGISFSFCVASPDFGDTEAD
jgi:hypothetical protein